MNRPRATTYPIRATASLALAGALLELAAMAGVYPISALAVLFSPDGVVGPSFRLLLEHAQQSMGLCLLLASPLAALEPELLRGAVARVSELGERTWTAALFISALGLALAVQWGLFDAQPHVTDETCHLFQSSIFAQGRVYAPLPPCPDQFFQFHMVMLDTGRWFSKYPPGQPLLLTPGSWMGTPWIAPPILFACTAVAFARLGILLLGAIRGRAASLFFVSSPLALLLGASYMSHIPSILFLALGILLLAGAAIDASRRAAPRVLLAGLCLGGSAIVRPQEIVIAAAIGFASLFFMKSDLRIRLLRLVPLLLPGVALAGVALVAWNFMLFQSFDTGYASTNTHLLTPLFKDQIGFSSTFGPAKAVGNAAVTCFRFNSAMTGWPAALLLSPLALWRPARPRIAWLSAVGMLTVMGAYGFYDYLGAEYEARYYTLALPFALVLLVGALERILDMAERWFGASGSGWFAGLVAAMILYAGGHYWPSYIAPKYNDGYEQVRPVVGRLASRDAPRDAVILVLTDGSTELSYSSVFHLNDPFLHGIVYARDHGGDAACLRNAFPGRPLFRFVPSDDWTAGRLEPLAPGIE